MSGKTKTNRPDDPNEHHLFDSSHHLHTVCLNLFKVYLKIINQIAGGWWFETIFASTQGPSQSQRGGFNVMAD